MDSLTKRCDNTHSSPWTTPSPVFDARPLSRAFRHWEAPTPDDGPHQAAIVVSFDEVPSATCMYLPVAKDATRADIGPLHAIRPRSTTYSPQELQAYGTLVREDASSSDKGRALLTGHCHHLVAKVNDREEGDPLRYEGLPAHWIGKEACIPMLVDLISLSMFMIGKPKEGGGEPTDEEQAIAAQQQQQGDTDAIGKWYESMAEEMNPAGKTGKAALGTSARAFTEFTPLIRMADKERSGVIGTMDQALLPFKNEAVRQRTEACDFTPDDLRGIWDEKAQKWKPVSLFICVNQAEAEAFATVTALLFEVISRYLLSYGPGELNEKTGRKLGPFPTCFMMDEFAKLEKVPAVIEGPDLGRSKKVSYVLVAQDYNHNKRGGGLVRGEKGRFLRRSAP